MIRRYFYLFYIVILGEIVSCSSPEQEQGILNRGSAVTPDSLVKYNKEAVEEENQQISDLVSRYQWKTQTTSTGLRYMIYKGGNGITVPALSTVKVRYTVKLITGELVYQTGADKLDEITLGKRKVTSGLEEGIMLMREGDHAKLIVPAHLAYGFTGDPGKIPGKATLVYDVALERVLIPVK